MFSLGRLFLVLFVLALAAVTLLFVLENQQSVALAFFGVKAPGIPSAVVVIVAFLLGMAVGPLLGVYLAVRGKRRFREATPRP